MPVLRYYIMGPKVREKYSKVPIFVYVKKRIFVIYQIVLTKEPLSFIERNYSDSR